MISKPSGYSVSRVVRESGAGSLRSGESGGAPLRLRLRPASGVGSREKHDAKARIRHRTVRVRRGSLGRKGESIRGKSVGSLPTPHSRSGAEPKAERA